MTKTIIGIDYSLSCPAICVHKGKEFSWSNCTVYYLTSVKKYEGDYLKDYIKQPLYDNDGLKGYINGRLHLPYPSQTARHDQISNWAISVIPNSYANIFLEGYSYGSKGLVFNLAENMGILKYKFYRTKHKFEVVVPGVVKKIATGKGNADKLKMYEQFVKDTKIDLMKVFEQTKLNNPVTDIVDAFYVAKAGYESIKSK